MLTQLPIVSGPRRIGELFRMCTDWDGYEIDLSPEYQRGDVWQASQQTALFRSLLLGINVGTILVNHRSASYEQRPTCVDGKQRLTALVAFYNSEVAIPTDWIDDRGIRETHTHLDRDFAGAEVRYSDLTKAGQIMIDSLTIGLAEMRLSSVEAELEAYLLINWGGSMHTPDDLARTQRVADQRPER